MNSIETKEIRGLSIRNLISIVLATATIVGTILVKTNNIEKEISEIRNEQITFGKINDMNFKITDAHFSTMQKQIDDLQKEIDDILSGHYQKPSK